MNGRRCRGSPLIGEAVRDLLVQWGTVLRLSPVRRPQYNGSVEAANGSMEIGTEHQAALAGRPGVDQGGFGSCPRPGQPATSTAGPHGPTPHDFWQQRPPITDRLRRRFAVAVADFRHRLALSTDPPTAVAQPESTVISARPQGAGLSVCVQRSRGSQGALQPRAIVNALLACRLLPIRRRLFTPPITH